MKSSTGGGSLVGQMIDIPGGFSIKENPSNETSNTEELDKDCKTCQGVGIISDWQPITDLTEKPEPETQSREYCCNQERNALRRARSSNTKLKKNYYTNTANYLYNRCQTFEQKQFNYLSTGNGATKPGAPLSQNNTYNANCNPNLEIQFTESQLPDGITLTPSNPLGCERVQYHPNNYKYAQQGAVSSSDRMLRLNVETIDTNRANIIKNRENLTKSKYFPNASGSSSSNDYDECCNIIPRVLVRQGIFILDITYNENGAFFRGTNQRALSYSSTDDAPIPVIQNDFISVSATYQTIGLNPKKVRMTVNFDIFTNLNDSLLTVGLSFADYVDNYYNLYTSILEIIQFGGMSLYGGGSQFAGLTPQILISAPDQPRIIPGTSALNCFMDCANFNSPAIINWNIANIVNLRGIFAYATLFNQPIGGWDTSNVTNMSYMFYGASAFNKDVTNWDVTNVTTMANMFALATNFNNGDITNIGSKSLSSWDVSNCTSFAGMFNTASSFNQYIGNWNTARVTDMTYMFQNARLFDNGELGTMDISGNPYGNRPNTFYLNSTRLLTSSNSKFIRDVSSTDVLIITYGPIAFPTIVYTSQIQPPIISDVSLVLLTAYGSDISSNQITSIKKQVVGTRPMSWNTSIQIPDLEYMFSNATYFNQDVSGITVGNATHMFSSTSSASPNPLRGIFNNGQLAGSNNNSLRNWNTVASGSIGSMFFNSAGFNQNISNWDVSKVTNMNATFSGATLFNNGDASGNSNQPLTNWYAPKSRNFATMFRSASSFNQAIPILVDSSGIMLDGSGNGVTMDAMFQSATRFNQNLNTWNTSKVSIMSSVFSTASVFNNGDASGASTQPLTWITDNVTTMSAMFVNALVFNQPIDTSGNYWNTGKVTNMFQMLAGSSFTLLFNQPIGRWDVSNCTTMGQMFYGANKFNQDISLWKTGNVTTMFQMFRAATLFNQTINTDASGSWNVSKVTDMSSMFLSATAFNNGSLTNDGANDLSWNASNCINFSGMFQGATSFNQKVNNLVNTAGVIDCSLNSMFQAATIFNNGQLGTMDVSGTPFTSASYIDSTRLLTSPNSKFLSQLLSSDVLIITSGSTIIYTSQIQSSPIVSDTSLVLLTAYGSAINAGNITSIKKQVAGTAPLTWNTTNVKNMSSLFLSAYYFNQNINNWSTSNVTNMSSMFAVGTTALRNMFNNGGLAGSTDASLNWYVPKCTNFTSMFAYTSGFNQPIPSLVDTSGVALPTGCSLANMFQNTTKFNRNINTWNVSRVTNMSAMFAGTIFNNGSNSGASDASLNWYVPLCTTFASMFLNAAAFNQPIPNLVDTSGIALPTGCSLTSMFQNSSATIPTTFNQNLSSWNVSRVTSMNLMFSRTGAALPFNNGSLINDASNTLTWYAPNCTTFASMFVFSTGFNQLIPFLVDTSGVALPTGCSLANMFQNAARFNRNLNTWNVSRVTNMTQMFSGTIFNNGDISGNSDASLNWYAPNCTTFSTMFNLATSFNQQIPNLVDTSGVTGCSLTGMFQQATRFNQNLNTWNVSRATIMSLVFSGASAFNNGQTGTIDISGNLNTSSAFYTNSSRLLTCTGGNFTTLTSADVLIITASTLVYSSQIQTTPISDVSLVLLTAYGDNISSGITSIKKQIAGTADLSWNTQLVTTTASMFLNATYFNQKLPWNMRLNRDVTSMFAATTSSPSTPQKFINLFNNGQILTGTSQLLYPGGGVNIWDFSGGAITGGASNAWHINSRLTSANGVTINPALTF